MTTELGLVVKDGIGLTVHGVLTHSRWEKGEQQPNEGNQESLSELIPLVHGAMYI